MALQPHGGAFNGPTVYDIWVQGHPDTVVPGLQVLAETFVVQRLARLTPTAGLD